MSNFTYGCDPEVFLMVGDKYVSAHGLFPGTKAEPFKVEKGAVQVDGLALEFNIDPAKTPEEFAAREKELTEFIASFGATLRDDHA